MNTPCTDLYKCDQIIIRYTNHAQFGITKAYNNSKSCDRKIYRICYVLNNYDQTKLFFVVESFSNSFDILIIAPFNTICNICQPFTQITSMPLEFKEIY